MRPLANFVATVCSPIFLVNCSSVYTQIHDPGLAIPSYDIVKSLRCEIVTFFESNYQRSLVHQELTAQGQLGYANDFYGFFDLDRWQYAALQVELRDVLSSSAMAGFDWKYPTRKAMSPNSKDWHLGPQISLTGTYDSTKLFAIPQYAALGPSVLVKDETEKLYAAANSEFHNNKDIDGYFCYKPISPIQESRPKRLDDLQSFVEGILPQYENFKRVRVDGTRTLAAWLQDESQKMSNIQRSVLANGENIIPGQFVYSFAIDFKASLDLKYTLVANVRSPFMPDLSGGIENTGTFTLYMNGSKSKAASAAKVGQSKILPLQQRLVPQTAGVVSELN